MPHFFQSWEKTHSEKNHYENRIGKEWKVKQLWEEYIREVGITGMLLSIEISIANNHHSS